LVAVLIRISRPSCSAQVGLHRSPILYMKKSIFIITKEMVGYSIYTDRFTLPHSRISTTMPNFSGIINPYLTAPNRGFFAIAYVSFGAAYNQCILLLPTWQQNQIIVSLDDSPDCRTSLFQSQLRSIFTCSLWYPTQFGSSFIQIHH
jgi:hypothetical protein